MSSIVSSKRKISGTTKAIDYVVDCVVEEGISGTTKAIDYVVDCVVEEGRFKLSSA
jgi:hypothetical protein